MKVRVYTGINIKNMTNNNNDMITFKVNYKHIEVNIRITMKIRPLICEILILKNYVSVSVYNLSL